MANPRPEVEPAYKQRPEPKRRMRWSEMTSEQQINFALCGDPDDDDTYDPDDDEEINND